MSFPIVGDPGRLVGDSISACRGLGRNGNISRMTGLCGRHDQRGRKTALPGNVADCDFMTRFPVQLDKIFVQVAADFGVPGHVREDIEAGFGEKSLGAGSGSMAR